MTTPRAVELIRVSTDAQVDGGTPELQRRALDALRVSRPCVLVERIEALGVSGALGVAHRADLRRLSALSQAHAFDELRVWSLDRLTRAADLRERAAIWGYALDAGATIVDANGRALDPSDEDGIGEVDYYLQTFFAQRERRKILARTAAGRRRAAEDGTLSQGQPPYGRRYDRESRQWVEVPAQMDTIRRVVRECLDGLSTRAIAAGLTRDGVPPARRVWSPSTVKKILRTPHLLGLYRVLGFTAQLPPVCDAATAQAVRASLATRLSSVGPRPLIPAMLRGMLWCPCGSRLRVVSDGRHSRPRYRCPSGDSRWLRVTDTDAATRGYLLAALLSPAALNAAAALGRDESAEASSVQPADLDAQEARLGAQEARVVRLLDDGLLSEAVARERLSAIRSSVRAIDAQRAAIQPPAAPVESAALSADRISRILVHASWRHWRELLGVLHARVTVEPSSLVLRCRLPVESMGDLGDSGPASRRWGRVGVPLTLRICA